MEDMNNRKAEFWYDNLPKAITVDEHQHKFERQFNLNFCFVHATALFALPLQETCEALPPSLGIG